MNPKSHVSDGSLKMFVLLSFLQDINNEQTLLEREQSQFPMLQTLIADKQPYEQLWTTALNFQSMSEEWMSGRWLKLGNHAHYLYFHDCVQKALNSTITAGGPLNNCYNILHFLDLLTVRSFPTPECWENFWWAGRHVEDHA